MALSKVTILLPVSETSMAILKKGLQAALHPDRYPEPDRAWAAEEFKRVDARMSGAPEEGPPPTPQVTKESVQNLAGMMFDAFMKTRG